MKNGPEPPGPFSNPKTKSTMKKQIAKPLPHKLF